MLDTLVTFIFYLITSVYSMLFAPFISVIFNLFPDLTNIITHIIDFVPTLFTYFLTAMELMLIPRACFILLFDYFAIKYAIYLITITIKLSVKIYHIFKP